MPDRLNKIAFEATNPNVKKMRDWILQKCAASTFNICSHKPLQQLGGAPLETHLENGTKPRACHSQADRVQDEKLGVLKSLQFGEPVSWFHRMMVTRKQDGSHR